MTDPTPTRDLAVVFDGIIEDLTGRGRGCWPEYKSWCRVPPEWHGQTRIFDLPISRADKIDLATLLFDADERGIVKNISLDERDELIALCKRLRREQAERQGECADCGKPAPVGLYQCEPCHRRERQRERLND